MERKLKSFFTGTFAFAGLVVMWVAVNAEDLLDRINNLDFKSIRCYNRGIVYGIYGGLHFCHNCGVYFKI